MNQDPQLKLIYIIVCFAIIFGALFVAAYPIMFFAEYLSTLLGIPEGAPVKDQENGWFFVVLFILEAVIIYLLSHALLSILTGKLKEWPIAKSNDVFIRCNYPKHWYK